MKHAASATLLGGKSATRLETSVYTYQLPETLGTAAPEVNLPGLPAGIYYASYDILWQIDISGETVGCYFVVKSDKYVASYSTPYVGYFYANTAASGVVDTRTHPATLSCYSSANSFALVTDDPVPDVTFMRIDRMSSADATFPAAHRKGSVSRLGHGAIAP